jgi:hypothetical protein
MRKTSTRPRFFAGLGSPAADPAEALAPRAPADAGVGTPGGLLGSARPPKAPKGFCPKSCPPFVAIFPLLIMVKRNTRKTSLSCYPNGVSGKTSSDSFTRTHKKILGNLVPCTLAETPLAREVDRLLLLLRE